MTGMILALVVLAVGIGATIAMRNTKLKKWAFGPAVLSVIVAVFSLVGSMIVSVPTGYTGVVTTFGRVEDYTYDAGFHAKAPWQEVITMDNRVQRATANLSCFSADIQEVSIVYTVNYEISKADAMTIYSTIGTDYYDKVIEPTLLESVKVVTAKYTAEDLISSRSELAEGIQTLLDASLRSYNIVVVSTAIEDMDFSDAFTNAVEAKQVAAQNKLQAQIEQEQKTMEAEQQAKRAEIQAHAQAEVAKIQAEADMEVAKIGADSAEYQGQKDGSIILQYLLALNGYHLADDKTTILDSSNTVVAPDKLTEAAKNLLQYYYIQGWDGKLPDVMAGDAATILVPTGGMGTPTP